MHGLPSSLAPRPWWPVEWPGDRLPATSPRCSRAKSQRPSKRRQARPGPTRPRGLTQLASLKDQGILTEEEFAAKKAEILSEM